jgi:hypothetical protein
MFRISDHLNLAKIDPAWRNVSCVDVAKNLTNGDQVCGLFMRGPSTIYFLVLELDSSVIPHVLRYSQIGLHARSTNPCENK